LAWKVNSAASRIRACWLAPAGCRRLVALGKVWVPRKAASCKCWCGAVRCRAEPVPANRLASPTRARVLLITASPPNLETDSSWIGPSSSNVYAVYRKKYDRHGNIVEHEFFGQMVSPLRCTMVIQLIGFQLFTGGEHAEGDG